MPRNIDAVIYFVNEVMPLLRKRLVDFKFYVIGSDPPEEVRKLASRDVVIVGFVENLDSIISSAKVSVAPLRFGAGVKGKVATSLSWGLPVVATPIAIEGMGLQDGKSVLVADDALSMAQHIERLFVDKDLWCSLSAEGRSSILNEMGPNAAWNKIGKLLTQLEIGHEEQQYELKLHS